MGERKGLPVRPQPSIVEAELGVREYWYDTFYRVVVVPVGNGCYLLSMDVYVPNPRVEGEPSSVLAVDGVPARLAYYPVEPHHLGLGNAPVRVERAELAVLEHPERRELVLVRLLVCGLSEPPDYNVVRSLYDSVCRAVGFRREVPEVRLEE